MTNYFDITARAMENSSQRIAQEFTNTTSSSEGYYVCWLKADSYEEYMTLLIMKCYVNPFVSFVGFVSNMISLAILRHSGLHKPSHLLLFSLVVADTMCLTSTLNYGMIIFYFGPDKFSPRLCGFQYDLVVNVYLTISSICMEFFAYWGQCVNSWIPVLITLERLLAIFKPMAFKSIVTKKRTLSLILFSFLFWLPWHVYSYQLVHVVERTYQEKIYLVVGYENYNDMMLMNLIEGKILEHLKSSIPVILIIVGCFCLYIKIGISIRNRSKLTTSYNSRLSSTRTTRTLMLTCFIFVVTQLMYIALMSIEMSVFEIHYIVRNEFVYLCNNINASSNLFVYITSNKKLYDIFLKFFRRPNKPKIHNNLA